jgi:hypothetical protein
MARIALPRTARVVAAALVAAVLLAFAGSAGAAPRASSSSACAKATKSLRAAKSRLAKAQRRAKRGRASRKLVAKARKAVRKAESAKRRACRVPTRPDGGPSGTPAPPSGGSPKPAPPPATPPTSHALIQKALEEGRIDAETALRYRVFAEFGDSRLPAEFRGSPLGVTDTGTLDEVTQQWDQLSPATRAVLDPFFIPPFNPGSWADLGSAAGVRALAQGAAAAPAQPGADLCANTAPNMNRWGYVTAAGGDLRVWYENTRAGQQDKAISVAEYLDSGAWNKVIGVFREPVPDGGDLEGKRCRGFDPSIDVVLAPMSDVSGRAISYDDRGDCRGPFSGFALVKRDLTGKLLKATVVHELAHVTHFAYSGDHCRPGIPWLTEATAAWTENYVGDLGPENPERYASWFFDRPGLPLETYEDYKTGTPRQYGAYLFFQWLAKNKGPAAVGQVWYYTESGEHPIDTTQLALRDLGYGGGFDEAWKKFALAGLNPRQTVDWFKQWGLPYGAFADSDRVLPDGNGLTLPVDLPHLSAQYHDLTITDAVKGVEVKNPFAGVPGASVQAWLRINDGGHERIEVRDISDAERTTFCRDIPSENVQEIALVIANSTHADRTHVLRDDVKVRGTRSCGAYEGTSTITIMQNGLTEVYHATYTLDFQWSRPLDGGGTETYLSTIGAHTASWSISGVSTSDGCTYSGQATWPGDSVGPEAQLYLRDFGKDHPETKYTYGYGVSFQVGSAHRSCPSGYQGDMYWQLGFGFQGQSHPWDPGDQGITGSETTNPGPGLTIKYDWTLSRKEIGP